MTTRPDAYPNYLFGVEIHGEDIASFAECNGPSLEMDVYEYEEGGSNGYVHKLPGRWKIGNLTLKRGFGKADRLWSWCQQVLSGAASGQWSLNEKNISVVLRDPTGAEVGRWTFVKAYPVKWTGPRFSASDNTVAIEEVEFAHRGLQV